MSMKYSSNNSWNIPPLNAQTDLILASRFNESGNPHRLSVWAVDKGWQAKIGLEQSTPRVSRP